MKPVVASLRSQGIRLIIYLDDILIIASSVETLNLHKKIAIDLLESLGFLINYKKSNLIPSQQIVFLGMLVDALISLTLTAKTDLAWWITALQIQQGSRIIPPSADLTISSDASKQGWGHAGEPSAREVVGARGSRKTT
jgi:hypothetical protein